MKKKYDTGAKIVIAAAILIGLYVLMCIFGGFPIPRGARLDHRYYTYYKNIMGIYYISVENALALINYGNWGYLKDVDERTFTVLDNGWAKDAKHVWYGDELIKDVDASTFHINSSGVPVDKHHVYILDYSDYNFIRPSQSGIDVETAEYFVYRLGELQNEWMRDKDFVYHYDKKVDVDRNSFQIYGEDWFIDKNFLYKTLYNDRTDQWDLHRLDSLQTPIEAGYHYFRNGRNIIYGDSVIVRDIDVQRFEEVGLLKYRVNDMLFYEGELFLKDSLDVRNARFYFYGHIAADNNSVYYVHNRLDDIDASTFLQIDEKTFEDKNFIYTIKEKPWGENYPFDKIKK